MHDVDPSASNVFREMKLAEDASKPVETALDGIPAHRHLRPQFFQERSIAQKTCDLDIESGGIQPVCGVNELPLGATDTKVVEELQNFYAIHRKRTAHSPSMREINAFPARIVSRIRRSLA